MASLQGPVIYPVVHAKQVGVNSVPVNVPLTKARILRSELWGVRALGDYKMKMGDITRKRRCLTVRCTFSSSSNGNGSMAENFHENDEDYVNSSVVEAGN